MCLDLYFLRNYGHFTLLKPNYSVFFKHRCKYFTVSFIPIKLILSQSFNDILRYSPDNFHNNKVNFHIYEACNVESDHRNPLRRAICFRLL